MPGVEKILIVGGGPAGALCGEQLARAGYSVTIFEERRGWEKPCGGGVTWKTLARYPFLLEGGLEKKLVRTAEFISPDGARALLALTRPLALYARAVLNEFLLQRAEAAGSTVVPTRASTATNNGCIHLRTAQGEFAGDFLVIAAGARNSLAVHEASLDPGGESDWRPGPHDLEQTVGYYLPLRDDRLRIQFLENFEGYLWSFPRADHLSVGICGKLAQNTSTGLREKLERFLETEGFARDRGSFFSHLLPSLDRRTWKRLALAGHGWARVGDAAGLVDPITGEGIYYALRSGELLAQSIIAGRPENYPAYVQADFARDLHRGSTWQPIFYRGRWWGKNTTARMIQSVQRSQRFSRLMDDLVAGTQPYRGLPWRLARMLASQLG